MPQKDVSGGTQKNVFLQTSARCLVLYISSAGIHFSFNCVNTSMGKPVRRNFMAARIVKQRSSVAMNVFETDGADNQLVGNGRRHVPGIEVRRLLTASHEVQRIDYYWIAVKQLRQDGDQPIVEGGLPHNFRFKIEIIELERSQEYLGRSFGNRNSPACQSSFEAVDFHITHTASILDCVQNFSVDVSDQVSRYELL